MQRGGLSPLYSFQLFRLPTANRTNRPDSPDLGFRPVELTYENSGFMPNDASMSIVRLFMPEGEALSRRTQYDSFVVKALKNAVAFNVFPRQIRGISPTTSVSNESRRKATQHLNERLITIRKTPLYIVLQGQRGALYAGELRRFEEHGETIVPNLVDRDGNLGLVPQGLLFARQPLARRSAPLARR